jgi:hypothetical protein
MNAIFCHRAFRQAASQPMPIPLYLRSIATSAPRGARGGRNVASNTTRHTHLCTLTHAINRQVGEFMASGNRSGDEEQVVHP